MHTEKYFENILKISILLFPAVPATHQGTGRDNISHCAVHPLNPVSRCNPVRKPSTETKRVAMTILARGVELGARAGSHRTITAATNNKTSFASKEVVHINVKEALEQLLTHLSLPLVQAAGKIGIGLTAAKMVCRKHGLEKWPHRRRQAVKALSQIAHDKNTCLEDDDAVFIKEALDAVSTRVSLQTLDYINDIWHRVADVKKKYTKRAAYQRKWYDKKLKTYESEIPADWCLKRKRTPTGVRQCTTESNSALTATTCSSESEASTEQSKSNIFFEPRNLLELNITAWWNDELHFVDDTDAAIDSLFGVDLNCHELLDIRQRCHYRTV